MCLGHALSIYGLMWFSSVRHAVVSVGLVGDVGVKEKVMASKLDSRALQCCNWAAGMPDRADNA
jgi:hypothetical protein